MSAPAYAKDGAAPLADKCGAAIVFKSLSANTSTLLVDASLKRRGLVLFPPTGGGTLTVNTAPIAATGNGLLIVGTMSPFHLCKYIHGDIVNKPLYGFASGGCIVGWIEVIEP